MLPSSLIDFYAKAASSEVCFESDDDYGTDCESVLTTCNTRKFRKLGGQPSTEKGYLACGLTETSGANTLIPGFGQSQWDQATAITSPRASFVERPSFLSDLATPAVDRAGAPRSAIASPTDQPTTKQLKSDICTGKPSVNSKTAPAAALQERKSDRQSAGSLQPPLLKKRPAPQFSNDHFAFARQSISEFVNNFLPNSPTEADHQTLEKLGQPYKRQHFNSQSTTLAPQGAGIKLARPPCLLGGLENLAPALGEGGAAREPTPMFGGRLSSVAKLRKNTQDMASDKDLFALQQQAGQPSGLPSPLRDDCSLTHIESGNPGEEGENSPRAEGLAEIALSAVPAGKCAKDILFQE